MTKIEAARALLIARNTLLAAESAALGATNAYVEAEKAYFEACKAEQKGDDTRWSDYPNNLLVDGSLIMPVSDWYDVREGSRLTFHTVEVA